jgi:hypothetical protein
MGQSFFGIYSQAGLVLSAVISGMFVPLSVGFSDGDPLPGLGSGPGLGVVYENSDSWAYCISDAPCPGSESSACKDLTPGSPCHFCDVPGVRQKCVFAWTTDCVFADTGSKKGGCGSRMSGTCQGGGSSVICLGIYNDGYCEQIRCATR